MSLVPGRKWFRRPHRSLGVVLAVGLSGCGAGWRRMDLVEYRQVPPKQVVEIWRGPTHDQWRGLQVSADSMSGIPYFQRLDCDSCRRTIALGEVDSLRCGDPVTPGVLLGLAPVFALVALTILVNLDGGLKD